MIERNNETLEAVGINNSDTMKKRDWWDSRFAVDKEMASLICKLEKKYDNCLGMMKFLLTRIWKKCR